MLNYDQVPHLVFDTTKTPIISEIAKFFTSALGLPTVSSGVGQKGDIYQWRNITKAKQKYLLQVMPPSDIIPEVIRSIVINKNMSNAAILFDGTFGKLIIQILLYYSYGITMHSARNHLLHVDVESDRIKYCGKLSYKIHAVILISNKKSKINIL